MDAAAPPSPPPPPPRTPRYSIRVSVWRPDGDGSESVAGAVIHEADATHPADNIANACRAAEQLVHEAFARFTAKAAPPG